MLFDKCIAVSRRRGTKRCPHGAVLRLPHVRIEAHRMSEIIPASSRSSTSATATPKTERMATATGSYCCEKRGAT